MKKFSVLVKELPATWAAVGVLVTVFATGMAFAPRRAQTRLIAQDVVRDSLAPIHAAVSQLRVEVSEEQKARVVIINRQRFNICVSLSLIEERDPRACKYYLEDPEEYLPPQRSR